MDLELTGKQVLVTGSHRGTGEVIAARFLAEGARVIVHGFENGAAEAAVERLGGGTPLTCDLLAASARDVLADLAESVTLDVLVNNYGTASSGRWGSLGDDQWQDALNQNVLSAVRCIDAFLPAMKEQRRGHIINLGTVGSTRPNARMPHYYASKGALATLTGSLAQELAGTGLRVHLVSPGLIRTPEVQAAAVARSKKAGGSGDWDVIEAELAADSPIGRIVTREEVADLVLFLASARAGGLYGQNLRVDGGQLGIMA